MPRARIRRCSAREGECVLSIPIITIFHRWGTPDAYIHSNYLHPKKSNGLEISCITVVHYIKSYISQLLFEPSIVKCFVLSKPISVPH